MRPQNDLQVRVNDLEKKVRFLELRFDKMERNVKKKGMIRSNNIPKISRRGWNDKNVNNLTKHRSPRFTVISDQTYKGLACEKLSQIFVDFMNDIHDTFLILDEPTSNGSPAVVISVIYTELNKSPRSSDRLANYLRGRYQRHLIILVVLYDKQRPSNNRHSKSFDYIAKFHMSGMPTKISNAHNEATVELEELMDYITSIKNLSQCMNCNVVTQKECDRCGNAVCNKECLIIHKKTCEYKKED